MNPLWEENTITDYRGTFLRCKICKTESKLFKPELLVVFSCPKCQKIYAKHKTDYNKLTSKGKKTFTSTIPLGTIGTIDKTVYTIIGCAVKREKNNTTGIWEEYVLLDQSGNYAFLNQSSGHWMILKYADKPTNYEPKSDAFKHDDTRVYNFYTAYYHLTQKLIGEFPYDVIDVKKTYTKEYIHPPFIFTAERNANTNVYFHGNYIKPGKIQQYFAPADFSIPHREGVGACQPFYFNINTRHFNILSVLLILLTLPFFHLLKQEPSNTALASFRLASHDSLVPNHQVSPSFEITGQSALLRFDSYSPVDNEWAEADMTLINENTGQERSFGIGVEYYHGVDDEGSWSEGSVSSTQYLDNVKPDKYHIEASLVPSGTTRNTTFQINAYLDYPTQWNYWLLVLILVGICSLQTYMNYLFEKKRME